MQFLSSLSVGKEVTSERPGNACAWGNPQVSRPSAQLTGPMREHSHRCQAAPETTHNAEG